MLINSKLKSCVRKCTFSVCKHELTDDLKAILYCVNMRAKVTVKVRLSWSENPKVTQASGMFYGERTHTHTDRAPALTLAVSVCFGVESFFANMNIIPRLLSALIFPDGLKHLEEIKFNKCIYLEDSCLERLSSIENLQESLYMMEVVSCGNVTDRGVIALHKFK